MPMNLVELTIEVCRVVREFDKLKHELKIEREINVATKAELAAAELKRDRWKAVHDRGWTIELRIYDGNCVKFIVWEKQFRFIAKASTEEWAFDAAFEKFPLEAKC